MIIRENYKCENGTMLIRTYSSIGNYIKQIETGEIYTEAIDVPNKYTYQETDELIEQELIGDDEQK